MATLFELTEDIQQLERMLEEIAVLLPEDNTYSDGYLGGYLVADEAQLAQKIDAYVHVYRDYQARAQAQRAEGKHLYDMAKANENAMERLKEAVKYASAQLGRSKLQGNTRSITVSETEKLAVNIVDANAIPDEFVEAYTELRPRKDQIALYVMSTGEVVNGVEVRKITTVRFN